MGGFDVVLVGSILDGLVDLILCEGLWTAGWTALYSLAFVPKGLDVTTFEKVDATGDTVGDGFTILLGLWTEDEHFNMVEEPEEWVG